MWFMLIAASCLLCLRVLSHVYCPKDNTLDTLSYAPQGNVFEADSLKKCSLHNVVAEDVNSFLTEKNTKSHQS